VPGIGFYWGKLPQPPFINFNRSGPLALASGLFFCHRNNRVHNFHHFLFFGGHGHAMQLLELDPRHGRNVGNMITSPAQEPWPTWISIAVVSDGKAVNTDWLKIEPMSHLASPPRQLPVQGFEVSIKTTLDAVSTRGAL